MDAVCCCSFNNENQRRKAWQEKLGLLPQFVGNAATRHGNANESVALDVYKNLSGHAVEHCAFDVLKMTRDGLPLDWIGGSPDGLIQADTVGAAGAPLAHLRGPGGGILEIKCPYSRYVNDDDDNQYLDHDQNHMNRISKVFVQSIEYLVVGSTAVQLAAMAGNEHGNGFGDQAVLGDTMLLITCKFENHIIHIY